MTDRLIVGRHPLNNAYGLWLSRIGVDAKLTIDPNDFLIAPYARNEMILMAGSASNGQTVYYPEPLTSKPMVYFWPFANSAVETQPFPLDITTTQGNAYCYVFLDRMLFQDASGFGMGFNYCVINRSIP